MLFSLPVLMYHSISNFTDGLCVSPAHFEDQCQALKRGGWRAISLGEAESYALRSRSLPRRSVLMTFDDGYLDTFVYAAPIMREYRQFGVVFPVISELEAAGPLRPSLDDVRAGLAERDALPVPESPMTADALGHPLRRERFCNWNEIRAMHDKATLSVAPHSTDHGRVLAGPEFDGFFTPGPRMVFFDRPPMSLPWGTPRFTYKPALAARAFLPAPELLDLVRRLVPQNEQEAAIFLSEERNLDMLRAAVAALPSLGREETEAEHRARLAQEFATCRERFTQELGVPPISFCWPWGRHTPEALEEAKKVGFQVFFTTRRGANLSGCALDVHRFRVNSMPGTSLLRRVRFFSCAPAAAFYGMVRPYR